MSSEPAQPQTLSESLYQSVSAPVTSLYNLVVPYIIRPVTCLLRPFVSSPESYLLGSSSSSSAGASGDYTQDQEVAFAAAAAKVGKYGGHLTTAIRLRLYALYKQATLGDAPVSPSGGVLDAAAQVKWRSWAGLRGMGRGEAMRLYTTMATQETSGGGASDAHGGGDVFEAEGDLPEELLDMESELSKGFAGPVMSTMAVDDDDDDESAEAYAGRLPLHSAARRGDPGLCRELLEAGAPVDAADEDGHTALHLACDLGEGEVVTCLLQHGAAPDAQNADGSTPLHMACACEHLQIAEALLRS
eukprot:3896284-Prymnesium_polylepis.1